LVGEAGVNIKKPQVCFFDSRQILCLSQVHNEKGVCYLGNKKCVPSDLFSNPAFDPIGLSSTVGVEHTPVGLKCAF
jgi:hypothetical protein